MTIAVIKEGVRVDEKYFFGQFLTFMRMMMMMMMMMMREYFFDNLRERRVQFQQCLNTCSRFLVLPVRDFLVNIIFVSIVCIIKMVNDRNTYPKIAYQ